MSLGSFTLGTTGGSAPNKPLIVVNVSFTGDTAYPTGGSTGIAAKVKAVAAAAGIYLGDITKSNILLAVAGDCGGYVAKYDAANDTLLAYYSNSDAADGVLIEVPNGTDTHAATFHMTFFIC